MKKGFTLVELIAVVTLLALIALVAIPVVDKVIKDGREDAKERQQMMLEISVQNWLSESTSIKLDEGDSITVTIGELKQGKFVDSEIKDIDTKRLLRDDSSITITKTEGILEYEFSLIPIDE